MIVFSNADGTIIDVVSTPVYQGSNLSGSIYFVAPIPRGNTVTVSFKLPNGRYSKIYTMIGVSQLNGITDKLGKEYSVWEWQDKNAEVTSYVGVCVAQFCIQLPDGQLLTTSYTSFEVQKGVLPILPTAPTDDVYDQILRYLGRLQGSLTVSIEKVPNTNNAIRYIDNHGVISAPIVIGGGEDSPIPLTAASVIEIPQDAWDATDGGGYTYTITAGMHGQMRDKAKAKDLWVSFDKPQDGAVVGAYEDYTIDAQGNITITAATDASLIVKVWNGNNLADEEARAAVVAEMERAEGAEQELHTIIEDETKRAEDAESVLQEQISELQNTGVDTTARENIEKLAEDITLTEDLTLAGNYTRVGNITKGERETKTYPAAGKTVKQILQEIFAQTLQPLPSQIVKPSVMGFTFDRANQSVEVGTKIDSVFAGTLSLNKGAYPYDTDTGVEASGYAIKRVFGGTETEISSDTSATDTNDGAGFIIGDGVTLSYRGTISYSEGKVASDNMGNPSEPPVRIEADTAQAITGTLRGYRNYFYGVTSMANPPKGSEITSDFIRSLTKSGKAYVSESFDMILPAGTTAVYIACIATQTGVTKVFNHSNNQDITSAFVDSHIPTPVEVNVEGAEGYNAVPYKVFYYVPAAAFQNNVTLTVTLG